MKRILQGKSEEIFIMNNIRHDGMKTHPADDTSDTFIVHPTPGDSVIEDDYLSNPRDVRAAYISIGFLKIQRRSCAKKLRLN